MKWKKSKGEAAHHLGIHWKLFAYMALFSCILLAALWLLLIAPFSELSRERAWLLLSGLLILCCGGLTLLLSGVLAKPIVALNHEARRLGKGEEVHFRASGYLEAEELRDSLNRAAEELQAVDRLRKEFVANLSHDLRTPLTMISGYAGMMQELPEEATPENARIIQEEAERMTALVNEVLELSQLQAGATATRFEPFNLSQLLAETQQRLKRLALQRGIKAEIRLNMQEEFWVKGDRLRLGQAIFNLGQNALFSLPSQGGCVELKQIQEGNRLKVCLSDNGPGIPDELLPHIWERYVKAREAKNVGSGLGLPIARAVLEAHHAQYGVESRLGAGSCFWFELEILS